MKLRVLTIIAALAAAQPALADPKPAELAAAKEAEARGAEMYAYDQAAWHATDRFMLDLPRSRGNQSELRGYIVEPAEAGLLKTTFFGEHDGSRYAYATYWVRGSIVERGGVVEPDGARDLSLLALRMIAARDAAIDQMRQPGHEICTRYPPNSLVLPPRADGTIPAYVLTSTRSSTSYPAGGHYRFDFDATNQLVGERRFMKACYDVQYAGRDDVRAEFAVLTHLLDPQPTEIHAFVSRYIPVPLMIVTIENRESWTITKGQIQSTGAVPDE